MTRTVEYQVVAVHNGDTVTSEALDTEDVALHVARDVKAKAPTANVRIEQRSIIEGVTKKWEPYRA